MIALFLVAVSASAFMGYLLGVVIATGSIKEELEALRQSEFDSRQAAAIEARERKAFMLSQVLSRSGRKPQVLQ